MLACAVSQRISVNCWKGIERNGRGVKSSFNSDSFVVIYTECHSDQIKFATLWPSCCLFISQPLLLSYPFCSDSDFLRSLVYLFVGSFARLTVCLSVCQWVWMVGLFNFLVCFNYILQLVAVVCLYLLLQLSLLLLLILRLPTQRKLRK